MSKGWKVGDRAAYCNSTVNIVSGPDATDNYCVMSVGIFAVVPSGTLKPIKTDAEIIVHEKIMNDMYAIVDGLKDADCCIEQFIEQLIDAGYRKVTPLSFTDYRATELNATFREAYDTMLGKGYIIGVKG